MQVPTEIVLAMDAQLQRHAIYMGRVTIAEILAAIAPLIAEECAKVADDFDNGRSVYDDLGDPIPSTAGNRIAAAIRERFAP